MLAGGKILKTVRVDHANCTEDFNLRDATINNAWKAAPDAHAGSQHSSFETDNVRRETFDIEDVAWSGPPFARHIATAASNGKIMLYDLDRPGVEVGRLHEHYRQVHKVDFNPIEGGFLLSGSQDGTVRLWDLREFRRNVTTFYSKDTFPGRSDGVRHTKWSRSCTWDFALGTDNGTVQRWDTRQNKSPVLKIAAHSGTCNSIDWHPDGKHLVSAGRDKNVKVWNLWADRKQKPAFQLRAPQEIQNVRWRPSCYVPGAPDQQVKQCTHLATSYRYYPMVHIWDLRRPVLPFKELYHEVNGGTTDMLWHSKDLIWTVGPGGEFNQTDVRYATRALDRRPLQAFSWAPNGEIDFFVQERPARSRAEIGLNTDESTAPREDAVGSVGSDASTLIKTYGDDGLDETFLSTSLPKGHSRSASFKLSRSLGSTPPSQDDVMRHTAQLDQAMRQPGSLAAEQLCMYGEFPFNDLDCVFEIQAQILLRKGIDYLETDPSEKDSHSRFQKHAKCAKFAGNAGDHDSIMLLDGRVSDALKDFPYGLSNSKHLNQRSASEDFERSELLSSELRASSSKNIPKTPRKDSSINGLASSNVTPLARPVSNREKDMTIGTTPPLNLSLGNIGENGKRHSSSANEMAHVRPPLIKGSISSDDGLPFEMSRRGSFDSVQMFSESSESQSKPSAFASFTSTATSDTADSSVESGEFPLHTLTSTPEGNTMINASSETLKRRDGPAQGQNSKSKKSSVELNGHTPTKNRQALMEHSHKTLHAQKTTAEGARLNQEKQGVISHRSGSSTSPSGVDPEASALALSTLQELLKWWTSQSDVQTASHIYLAAAPIIGSLASVAVGTAVERDVEEDSALHEYLTSVHSFSPSGADSIIRHYHEPLSAAGLPSAWIESILLQYHQQLTALCLFQEAASLRRLSCPAFPAVYDQGIGDFEIYTMCPSCRAPLEAATESDKLRCDKCDSPQPDCPFCWKQQSPYKSLFAPGALAPGNGWSKEIEEERLQTHLTAVWTACALCNHSAHAACALKWFSDSSSDGICPHDGCYCACDAGTYRDELIIAARAKQKQQDQQRRVAGQGRGQGATKVKSSDAAGNAAGVEDKLGSGLGSGAEVKQDDWKVGESSAVRRVSGALRRQDQRRAPGHSLKHNVPHDDKSLASTASISSQNGLSGAVSPVSAAPTSQQSLRSQSNRLSAHPQNSASKWWPRNVRGNVSDMNPGNVASSSSLQAKEAVLESNPITGTPENAAPVSSSLVGQDSATHRERRRHGNSLDGFGSRGSTRGRDAAQQKQHGLSRGVEEQQRGKKG